MTRRGRDPGRDMRLEIPGHRSGSVALAGAIWDLELEGGGRDDDCTCAIMGAE